ncbi:MAG: transketolase family protein [Patescibacteria group bacterium]|nr:transketolase family protein [Patescibacteria group bacterium]
MINPNIFNNDVEQVPIRKGFGEGLVIAGDNDIRVVGLCADLTDSTMMSLFAKKYSHRFVEMGVAEQNLASVASGMAAMGKIPFITSYAMFSPGRNWEQIRTTICYNNRPVKIAGSHAGVSVGPDGGTHQAIEDIAITRVIPRMVVISPCDAIEARKATIASAKTDSPTYIRLAREKTPIITTNATSFEIGKAQVFFDGAEGKNKNDVGIIATGALVYRALKVAQFYKEQGIKIKVLNLATIKPLDEQAILSLAQETKAIVTVEEHQIAGGMGSAISEYLAQHYPVPQEFIGVKDLFGQSGTPDELLEYYGMGESHIKMAVKRVILRK